MKMPKYKPTKWKMRYCIECKSFLPRWKCKEHTIIERDNIPFFVPDMRFEYLGAKWSRLKSDKMNDTFSISASKVHDIVMGCGVLPGGHIPNQWWMWAKVGGSTTLRWVPPDDDSDK